MDKIKNPDKARTLPSTQEPNLPPGAIARDTALSLEIASWPRIDYRDAEEVRGRCEQYFEFCCRNDRRPTVSGLYLSLGISKERLWHWGREESPRGEVVRTAKAVIANLLETWTIEGHLNPPVGIFWAKNFLGMRDTVQIEAVDGHTKYSEAAKSPEELRRLIEEDIPLEG